MTEQTTENFIFYNSFFEAIKEFDDDKRLELYDAIMSFAFNGEETNFFGMQKAVFSLIKPLITASIKNYKNGSKGGRPPKEEEQKNDTVSNNDIDAFIADYTAIKNPDFVATKKDRKLIAEALSDFDGYDPEYWNKVFEKSTGVYRIEDKEVECTFKNVISNHNAIYTGEHHLYKRKADVEKMIEQKKAAQKKQQEELDRQCELEAQERVEARNSIETAQDAIVFLNKYVPKGNLLLMRVASDYKEFKSRFNGITLDEKIGEYVLCQN